MDAVRGLIASAPASKVSFYLDDGLAWFSYEFNSSVVARGPAYKGVIRGRGLCLNNTRCRNLLH